MKRGISKQKKLVIRVFFGIELCKSLVRLRKIAHYWNARIFLEQLYFSKFMFRN